MNINKVEFYRWGNPSFLYCDFSVIVMIIVTVLDTLVDIPIFKSGELQR